MNQALYDHLIELGFPENYAQRMAQAEAPDEFPYESAESAVWAFDCWSTTKEGFEFWRRTADRVRIYGVQHLATVEIPQ